MKNLYIVLHVVFKKFYFDIVASQEIFFFSNLIYIVIEELKILSTFFSPLILGGIWCTPPFLYLHFNFKLYLT